MPYKFSEFPVEKLEYKSICFFGEKKARIIRPLFKIEFLFEYNDCFLRLILPIINIKNKNYFRILYTYLFDFSDSINPFSHFNCADKRKSYFFIT